MSFMSFLCSFTETIITMRSVLIVAILLSIAAAYYIYLPLPSTISEPWKLMFMDSVLRGVMHVVSFAFVSVIYSIYMIQICTIVTLMWIQVTETSFGGVQAQVFESTAADQEPHLKRGVVYFHGGGWTLGSGTVICKICMFMYTLAPEARFPDQYNEAVHASKHILTAEVLSLYSIDPKRVAVSGDSAGANLAAAVAQQMALDNSDPIKFKVQALLYPTLQALDFNTPCISRTYLNGDPKLMSLLANNHTTPTPSQEIAAAKAKTDWTKFLPVAFQKNYKPVVPLHGDPKLLEKLPGLLDVRAAPLLADMKVLKAVLPAYIMTCEHDVLRDDGLMYATRLEEVGVDVTVDHYEDGFHGCLSFAFGPFRFSVGFRSFRNYTRWLKENL
uniref:Neutral cholesterol ester hydrolase 1 n=1 Tax=Sinocyclocheilus grahami TaxID=75366 RepID=A0A672QIC2_SINGR